MVEAVVCASCPESYHDRVAKFCLQHQVQNAWKGRRYGECTKWKRLDSQMGSQSSAGNGGQGTDFEFWQGTYPMYCGRQALWCGDGQTTCACWGNQNRDGKQGMESSRRTHGDQWMLGKISGRQVKDFKVYKGERKAQRREGRKRPERRECKGCQVSRNDWRDTVWSLASLE